MSRRIRLVIAVVIIAAIALLVWRWLDGSDRPEVLTGYVEADTLFLAAPVAGTVSSVSAVEGARVRPGQQLFTIDPATLTAERQQAQAQVQAARMRIASAEANVEQAEADAAAAAAQVERARRDLSRLESVRRNDAGAVAATDVDSARAALREATARLAAARDLIAARRAQVASARAEVQAAQGGAREVGIRVAQLSPAAPAEALVEQVYFQPGEWVAANQPVVGLIPDGGVKLRFFVPEAEIDLYRPGRSVRFACDGCEGELSARISYVSPRPEFTPPVIFSRDSRERLVFMVEAVPARARNLRPGLPVDVMPLGEERER